MQFLRTLGKVPGVSDSYRFQCIYFKAKTNPAYKRDLTRKVGITSVAKMPQNWFLILPICLSLFCPAVWYYRGVAVLDWQIVGDWYTGLVISSQGCGSCTGFRLNQLHGGCSDPEFPSGPKIPKIVVNKIKA